MTKQRHCYVTDVGIAIEKLADALDPERKPPFSGDILDLLEWAAKDVLAMRQQLDAATDSIAAAVAACKIKDDAFNKLMMLPNKYPGHREIAATGIITEALAVMPSISEWKTRWQKENDELRQQLEQAHADVAGLHDQVEEPQINQDDYRLNKLELEEARQQLADRDAEVAELRQQIEQWVEKAKTWMASPEAGNQLDGYRAMGAKCAELEAENELLRQRLGEVSEAFGLPKAIGPAPGEIKRILSDLRQQLAAARAEIEELQANLSAALKIILKQ